MLNNLLAYLKANKRQIKKHIRSNLTRVVKDAVHDKVLDIRISYLKTRLFFSQLHNLRLLGMFIIMFWFFRDLAFAAEKPSDLAAGAVEILNFGIGLMTFLIGPLVMLAGWLLSPDWTYGEIFGLRAVFHALWVTIGNIVYVAFAFILIYIAFVNIFSEKKSTFQISQALPRLIVGILIVPFSWFLVSGVTSLASILTASVIRLPIETINTTSGGNGTHFINKKTIPKSIIYDQTSTNTGTGTSSAGSGTSAVKMNGKFTANDCEKDETGCISIMDMLTGPKGSVFNLLSAYAYGIFKLPEAQKIDITEVKSLNSIFDLLLKGGFSIIFFIMFGILLLAIIFALFSRMAKLWIYIIFSPAFGLAYFFKEEGKIGGEFKKANFSIGEMISLAMVPVYVAAALSFGLVFLSAVQSNGPLTTTEKLESDVVTINDIGDSTQEFIFGDVSFKTVGVLSKKTEANANGVLTTGRGIIGTIIINFLALGVLWMSVMAALGANKITETAAAPFKSMGDSVGKLIKESPKYAPIPLPGGKSMSVAGMQRVADMPKQALDTKTGNSVADIQDRINRTFGVNTIPASVKDKFIQDVSSAAATKEILKERGEELKNYAAKHGRTDSNVIAMEMALAKALDANKNNRADMPGFIVAGGAGGSDIIKNGKVDAELLGTLLYGDKIKGREYALTKNKDGDEPAAASAVKPKVDRVEHSITDKQAGTPAEIKLKLEGVTEHKVVALSKDAIISDKTISISKEDKDALSGILDGLSDDKAIELLEKMFTGVKKEKIQELLTKIR